MVDDMVHSIRHVREFAIIDFFQTKVKESRQFFLVACNALIVILCSVISLGHTSS